MFKKVLVLLICLLIFSCGSNEEGEQIYLSRDTVKFYTDINTPDQYEFISGTVSDISVENRDTPIQALENESLIRKWYKITFLDSSGIQREGWVDINDLIFNTAEAVNAVVLAEVSLFSAPDSKLSKISSLKVGDTVIDLGYYYNDGYSDFSLVEYKDGQRNWADNSSWIIKNAKVGVVTGETLLYSSPDMTENTLSPNIKLSEFDIVAVGRKKESRSWPVYFINRSYTKKYYINRSAVSFTKKDVDLALLFNDDYYRYPGHPGTYKLIKIRSAWAVALNNSDPAAFLIEKEFPVKETLIFLKALKSEYEKGIAAFGSTKLTKKIKLFILDCDSLILNLSEL